MRKILPFAFALFVVGFAAAVSTPAALAQSSYELVDGKSFDSGFVKDFYLEGNAIPTQKRNAAMLKGTDGKRIVFGLLDTTGYSAEIQTKYIGMALVEKEVMVGTTKIPVGAYGFGLQKPVSGEGPAKLLIYDLAGQKVGETATAYDAGLAQPAPLKVAVAKGQPTKLLLGKYWVEIK